MIEYKVEKNLPEHRRENKMEYIKKKFTNQFQNPGIYFLGVQNREQWQHKGKIIKETEKMAQNFLNKRAIKCPARIKKQFFCLDIHTHCEMSEHQA